MPTKTIALTEKKAAEFGKMIEDLRLPKTQPELAADGRFSIAWLSKLENGRLPSVSVTRLAYLSRALGFAPDALENYLKGTKLPSRGPETTPPPDTGDERAIRRIQQEVDLLRQRLGELEEQIATGRPA